MPISKDFQKILDQFTARYGDAKGKQMYYAWIKKRSLDDTKPYSNDQLRKKECLTGKCTKQCGKCLRESFNWAKPLIKLLKNDATGKTYQVEAHFAVTSMNNNIYTAEELAKAVSTLPGKHVDINHNLEWIVQGVDMLAAAWEDGAIEVLIHVDNGVIDAKGRNFQDAIATGIFDCVSVEVNANDYAVTPEGFMPVGLEYTGLAFLDQDALPGIPLTTIQPIEEMIHNECLLLEQKTDQNPIEEEVKKQMSEQPQNQTPEQPKTKEQTAAFCPTCGNKLDADGVCQNKECPTFGKQVQVDAEKLAVLNEALAKKDSELAEAIEKQKVTEDQNASLTEKLGKAQAKINQLDGRLRETEKRVSDRDKRIDEMEKDIEKFREDIGALTAARENAISEKNVALSQAAKDSERANIETQERAHIQRELAILRSKTAESIRGEAETSQKLADESKRHLDLETENKQLHEELRKRDIDNAEKQRCIEKAIIENKRMYKILRQNGIAEIDPSGNITISS